MKKKVLIGCISAIFMLIAISYAVAANTNIANAERKESPLYSIRVKQTICQRIGEIMEKLEVSFLGESKIFFVSPVRIKKYKKENKWE